MVEKRLLMARWTDFTRGLMLFRISSSQRKLPSMSIKKNSVVLLQGVFKTSVFDLLKQKKVEEVFVLEGRPGLESARQSCRELLKRKIRPTLVTDNMAGFLFYKNLVKEVWLSCQT